MRRMVLRPSLIAMDLPMSIFPLGVFLRYLFTAAGVLGVVMQLLRPVWEVHLAGGQSMHPSVWAWQEPDLTLVAATSSGIDWMATLGPAAGMAICTFLWWRFSGRLQRFEAAQIATAPTRLERCTAESERSPTALTGEQGHGT